MAVAFDQLTDAVAKLTGAVDSFTISRANGAMIRKGVHQDDEGLAVAAGSQDDVEGPLVDRLGLLDGNLL